MAEVSVLQSAMGTAEQSVYRLMYLRSLSGEATRAVRLWHDPYLIML